jgi:carbamoyltransferase
MEDGEIIYYIEEDRLNKVKQQYLTLEDPMKSLTHLRKYTTHIDHLIFSSYVKWNDTAMMDMAKERLSLYGITYGEVHYEKEHHLWHATNAFYSSTFDEAGALICDGGGRPLKQWFDNNPRRELESMYYFFETNIHTLQHVYGSDNVLYSSEATRIDDKTITSSTLSNGWIFNTINWCCGFNIAGGSGGKVMGISPYGVARKASTDEWFKRDEEADIWITHNENILNTLRSCFDPIVDKKTQDPPPFSFETVSNICQKTQEETRKHTIRLIRDLLGRVNTKNVVLSGGYFLNCVNNYHYIKEFPEINFYIDPLAHDGGTAMGAVFYVWHHILKNKKRHPLKTLFLG